MNALSSSFFGLAKTTLSLILLCICQTSLVLVFGSTDKSGSVQRKLGLKFSAVLDEFGNSTEKAYTGWPDRMYLIDSRGRIAYKSSPGPFVFKPQQLGAAIAQALAMQASK